MYTTLSRITPQDIEIPVDAPLAETSVREEGLGVTIAVLMAPLAGFAAGIVLAQSAQVGLCLFALGFAAAAIFNGVRRARARKASLVSLLRGLRYAGEPDIELSRRFDRVRFHHRHLAAVELVALPLLGLAMAAAELLIILAPGSRAVGGGAITGILLAIAAMGVHIHRHHTRLRSEIQVAMARYPVPPSP